MPTPLDPGRGQRTPDARPSRPAPPPPAARRAGPLTLDRAPRNLPLRSFLLSLPAAARTPGGGATARRARLRPAGVSAAPDRPRLRQDRSVAGILRAVLRAARRSPRALTLAAALLVGAPLAACTPSAHATAGVRDPLAALRAPVQSKTFGLAFWVGEQAGSTRLWRQAFAYCRFRPRQPGCRAVRMASWWGSPPPSGPPEGSHP